MTSHIKLKHRGPIIADRDNLKVIRCENCGYVHLHPLPDADESRKRYEARFYTDDKPGYAKETVEDMDWLMQCQHVVELAALECAVQSEGRDLLDVGAGLGTFLVKAKEYGWNGMGIEPGETACKELEKHGLRYQRDYIENVELAQYDAIRAAWVLEHVFNPRKVLAKLVAALKPGGAVLVILPNEFSLLQTAMVEKNYWLGEQHITYFEWETIENLFADLGLEVLIELATFPMELFALMGHRYVGDTAIGRQVHGWRKRMELALMERNPVALITMMESWARARVGRDMIIVGRKN